jgi:hypothetical protein
MPGTALDDVDEVDDEYGLEEDAGGAMYLSPRTVCCTYE